ncbi:Fur family transcriptional regulator [Alcaligenes endophyticus]|uniref:Ferric uptake regulation protein n=1 Tax=Alcaligenes endophyticus TaxID=1929088 RepID=A0ABT8EG80_9BURK|nr:Fur family transcriptional regulator [Alcaligenes endophyticus]MCX5590039.1 Fur family transcriptional regulator [Alcaligenes endophyticus]MDN4120298.1 transcriptional repressor [Alcaligenes endophyticus]
MPVHILTPLAIEQQLATAEKLCLERGKRLTAIRKHVLEILLRAQRSLKAYELLDMIRGTLPGATPPTVYRALDFLTEEGLIHRLDAVNAWTACVDAGGHPHDLLVVCTQCGTVAELSAPALSHKLANYVADAGFSMGNHEIELRAICSTCQDHENPEKGSKK